MIFHGKFVPFFRRFTLKGLITFDLEHVPDELLVLFVVFDDKDQFASHYPSPLTFVGSVKVKVEPLPTSLSTQILPPCNSTNFFASVNPRPVPSLFRASAVPTWRNSSKTFAWSSGEIPIPVSLTEISTEPSACLALIPIRPPSGVNLTAFDSKLRRICLILRSSPTNSPSRSSTVTSRLMPCFVARSRTKVRALSIA